MRPISWLLTVVLTPLAASGVEEVHSLSREREMFPDVIETIMGKYVRHSPEFYQWQIKDRLGKLGARPNNPVWQDELAMAQAKTGTGIWKPIRAARSGWRRPAA